MLEKGFRFVYLVLALLFSRSLRFLGNVPDFSLELDPTFELYM